MSEEVARPKRLSRAETKARTREQLLEAAALVFADKGFAGASVEEIAEAAGYSTGALYSNFDSKEQLFLELLAARRTQGVSRRIHAVEGILDRAEANDADPFDALGQLFLGIADRISDLAPLQAEFWLYAVRNPDAMGVIADKLGEQTDALEPLVARALTRFGDTPAVAPRELTTAVLALLQGLIRQRRVDPGSVPNDLFARALRWMLAGVFVDPPSH